MNERNVSRTLITTKCRSLVPVIGVVLVINSCGGNTQIGSDSSVRGPIDVSNTCRLPNDERIGGFDVPVAEIRAFESCVAQYGSDNEAKAASKWIGDWFVASDCIHRCDAAGINEMAHGRMLTGLRFLAAETLPSSDASDAACSKSQLDIRVKIDEGMSAIASWKALAGPECVERKLSQSTLRRLAGANRFRQKLSKKITTFQTTGQ